MWDDMTPNLRLRAVVAPRVRPSRAVLRPREPEVLALRRLFDDTDMLSVIQALDGYRIYETTNERRRLETFRWANPDRFHAWMVYYQQLWSSLELDEYQILAWFRLGVERSQRLVAIAARACGPPPV